MPDGFRPAAKAIVAAALTIIGVLVVFGVIDPQTGKDISVELIGIAAAFGIVVGGGTYATKNR